mmetsp:Transcript_16168/g.48895  ORF Transcript_16168/g.48895 Transcript_16168/m.48895 type:complete len:464 (-) Transcript_16168:1054-2445(-)
MGAPKKAKAAGAGAGRGRDEGPELAGGDSGAGGALRKTRVRTFRFGVRHVHRRLRGLVRGALRRIGFRQGERGSVGAANEVLRVELAGPLRSGRTLLRGRPRRIGDAVPGRQRRRAHERQHARLRRRCERKPKRRTRTLLVPDLRAPPLRRAVAAGRHVRSLRRQGHRRDDRCTNVLSALPPPQRALDGRRLRLQQSVAAGAPRDRRGLPRLRSRLSSERRLRRHAQAPPPKHRGGHHAPLRARGPAGGQPGRSLRPAQPPAPPQDQPRRTPRARAREHGAPHPPLARRARRLRPPRRHRPSVAGLIGDFLDHHGHEERTQASPSPVRLEACLISSFVVSSPPPSSSCVSSSFFAFVVVVACARRPFASSFFLLVRRRAVVLSIFFVDLCCYLIRLIDDDAPPTAGNDDDEPSRRTEEERKKKGDSSLETRDIQEERSPKKKPPPPLSKRREDKTSLREEDEE